MKHFSERNPRVVGAVGMVVTAAIVLGALQYNHLPPFNAGDRYSAYFAEAGGLVEGDEVQVSGDRVGQVLGVDLDGPRVLVRFKTERGLRIGDRSEAAIKAKTVLGAKILEITPRGDAPLSGPIPLERTISPYQLPDALGDLSNVIKGIDTDQLSQSLQTLSETFAETPPSIRQALEGATRLATTIDKRDAKIRELLANANTATTVLGRRTGQIASLITDTNNLLAALQGQIGALDAIAVNVSALARELSGFVADNRTQLKPALDKLNGVLTLVDNRKGELMNALKLGHQYMLSFGESASSGPFSQVYIANLLPGQFLQPFIDAAFSDLGVDPSVLLPSQRSDPQVGQPGTPAMPMPFPRTGQGGEPRLTLPDAITGKPGDPRYPYREPPPAPPPGGPPPGPPADIASRPAPTPSSVYAPAPNEVPPTDSGQDGP